MEKSSTKKLTRRIALSISHQNAVRLFRVFLFFTIGEILISIQYKDAKMLSGLIAGITITIVASNLFEKAAPTLKLILDRGIISDKLENDKSTFTDLRGDFLRFIDTMTRAMAHPAQIVLALLIMLLALARLPIKWGGLGGFMDNLQRSLDLEFFIIIVTEAVLGFVIGIIIWRILILGIWIGKLGREFPIMPILGHSDKCGGLQPIGDLCLQIGVITSLPLIFAAAWLIYGLPPHLVKWIVPLVSIFIPLPYIAFLLPLWNIHKNMQKTKDNMETDLNQLISYINVSVRELVARSQQMSPNDVEERLRKLNLLKQTYNENQEYPVWPINIGNLLKFLSSQIIPVIAVVKSVIGLFIN